MIIFLMHNSEFQIVDSIVKIEMDAVGVLWFTSKTVYLIASLKNVHRVIDEVEIMEYNLYLQASEGAR